MLALQISQTLLGTPAELDPFRLTLVLENGAYKVKRFFGIKHLLRQVESSILESLQVWHVEDENLGQLELRLNHLNILDCLILRFFAATELLIKRHDEIENLLGKE